jgi:N-acetylglutamate synthase-like GNAT family acetyltransferase
METRELRVTDLPALRELAAIATAEGYRFVARFLADLQDSSSSSERFAGFLVVLEQGQLVALGGVTPDPYRPDSNVGRVRHVYVHPTRRGEGIGADLIATLETRARSAGLALLRLRTDTSQAAQFYEHLGYSAVADDSATHQRSLTR